MTNRERSALRKGNFQASHLECMVRSFNPTKTSEACGGTPVLHMWKLRHGQMKWLVLGLRSSQKWI